MSKTATDERNKDIITNKMPKSVQKLMQEDEQVKSFINALYEVTA